MQSLSEMPLSQWLKLAVVAVGLFILFQTVTAIGQMAATFVNQHRALDEIERRISLDSAYLDVGNQALNTPVNDGAVYRYLGKINGYLKDQQYPMFISSIQNVRVQSDTHRGWTTETVLVLSTAEQQIKVAVAMAPVTTALHLHPLPILFALLLAPVAFQRRPGTKRKRARNKDVVAPPKPKLVIDMNAKSIGNGISSQFVQMQNKPFCFYIALVRYCIDNPQATLPQNKDAPQELINIANRVFLRLIELGHTKRKRPDFNANLDKTLSEIRAALDESFMAYPQDKEKYYPPRAQGEGSRSKQHSYALPPLSEEDLTIIGK
ncbi:hypothetical protein [Aestuariibacter sp. A3R04]|uniref:hypothetical protein n=1 Tax=Aestuariibacter sp. A3R04 TaxID=2841571 RepID=UPI0020901263|nr:hypothetical protein [Aestuariibacter sp. A3R04]